MTSTNKMLSDKQIIKIVEKFRKLEWKVNSYTLSDITITKQLNWYVSITIYIVDGKVSFNWASVSKNLEYTKQFSKLLNEALKIIG